MTEILHLMRLASPAKGLPALLAAFFAALSGIALIGAAAVGHRRASAGHNRMRAHHG